MLANILRSPKPPACLAVMIASGLMMLVAAESASAGGGKTNNGPPSTRAIYNGPSNDVRDHRGQRNGPPPPPARTVCHRSPYGGGWRGDCSGVVFRDHRGVQGGGGSAVCGRGANVNCPPLHEK